MKNSESLKAAVIATVANCRDRWFRRRDADHLDFITPEIIESFCVLGSPEQHIAKIKALEEAGTTQFNIYLDSGDEENIIARYTEEVIPAIQS